MIEDRIVEDSSTSPMGVKPEPQEQEEQERKIDITLEENEEFIDLFQRGENLKLDMSAWWNKIGMKYNTDFTREVWAVDIKRKIIRFIKIK